MPEIALFGGSFDPPHVGHVLAAHYLLATEPFDRLWLVPVHEHPLGKKLAASFEHRVELCRLAVKDLARVEISTAEEDLGGEGRTVDLLEHLVARYPGTKFALVLGTDLVAERPLWKRYDRIQELARIVPLQRAGYAGEALLPEVSSTQVRALLKAGQDVSHLVPRAVLQAIHAAGTYR